jgi:L-aminopeptidase/D-esterase-like protein
MASRAPTGSEPSIAETSGSGGAATDGLVTDGSITDVAGVRVGQVTARRRGWRTGTTVVLTTGGAVGGVDVRGGGPGTRETDLLRPENLVQHVHAVCLTGGSAYGLAAATGVMTELESRGIGFPVGVAPTAGVVPIVPAAVIYDLGRGGVFTNRPDAAFGARAVRSARATVGEGAIGAGTGAVAGSLQGGVGTASITLADGTVVGALAVVNSVGAVIDPVTGLPWVASAHRLRRPAASDRAALAARLEAVRAPLNTTIGVVATSIALTKAECQKMAGVAHDGMARAIRPSHTLFDGDTVFALSTGTGAPGPGDALAARARAATLNIVFEAGAMCFAIACTRAVLAARSVPGGPPAYRDLCPSAFAPSRRRSRR